MISNSTLSSNEEQNKELREDNTPFVTPKKRASKSAKKHCPQDKIDVQLAPAKNYFLVNSKNYQLDFDKLAAFLKEAYGNKDIPGVAHQYTSEISDLIKMLNDAHPLVLDSSLKARITKIIKRLKWFDTTSDVSSVEDQEMSDSFISPYPLK